MKMANNHEDGRESVKSNVKPIFQLLTSVIKSKFHTSEQCVAVVKNLVESDEYVGSTSHLKYTVKRLVRGLGSTRFQTQCACFSTLCAVLKHRTDCIEEVLAAIDSELDKESGSVNSSILGTVLTLGAVVNSGMFFQVDSDKQQEVLKKLLQTGSKKSHFSYLYVTFFVELLNQANDELFKNVLWPFMKKELQISPGNSNFDHFYLLLACFERFPRVVSKFVKQFSSIESLYESILSCILNTKLNNDHPAFDSLAKGLVKDPQLLSNVWTKETNEFIPGKLNKDLTLLHVFLSLVKNVTDSATITELLNSKMVDVLIRVLAMQKTSRKGKEKAAQDVGREALQQVVELLKPETVSDAVRMKTIKRLLFYPGNVKFDMVTGTKCVQMIVGQLGVKSVVKLSGILHQVVTNESKKTVSEEGGCEPWNSKERQYVLQVCGKLLNHPAMLAETAWKQKELEFIFDTAFGENTTADFQKAARESFYHAVKIQMPKLEGLVAVLTGLMLHIDGRVQASGLGLSEDHRALWTKVMTTIGKLGRKAGNKSFVVIHLLLIHVGLQLFRGDDHVGTSIDDLITCYRRLKARQGDAEGSEEPHWTEVTVDLLLSLLSKEDRVWRHVVSCIFPHVLLHMTDSGLHQIIDALDPNSEKNVLSHVDSDESGSDIEESESDDEEPEEEEEDEEEDEKANDKLRMAVRTALGYSAALTDEESVDMDDMDEAEEKRLNESLANAFRLFKSSSKTKSKKQSKEDEAQTHFRNRVLDLIDIYIANNPSMSGCLDILLPLFGLLETAIKDHHQKPLQNRLENILGKLSAVKKFKNHDGVDTELLMTTFRAVVHREVGGLLYVEMAPRISTSCTFLVRCSQMLTPGNETCPLVAEYATLASSFFKTRDSRLPLSMFQSVLRMLWVGNWKLVETLYGCVLDPNLRPLRKMKVLDLLSMFYKNSRLHAEAEKKHLKLLNKLESSFAKDFLATVPSTVSNGSSSHPLLLKFLSFFSVVHNSSKQHRSGKSDAILTQIVSELNQTEHLLAHNKIRMQLCNLSRWLGLAPPKAPEKKTTTVKAEPTVNGDKETDDDEEKGKKKKKKRSKNHKLKKESQDLRMSFTSQGLESVPFSSIKLESIKEEPLTPAVKKRKSLAETNGIEQSPKSIRKKIKTVK